MKPDIEFPELEIVAVSPTESQKEIWFSCMMSNAASCAYNESFTITFTGTADAESLEKAVLTVVGKHDALSLVFSADGLTMTMPISQSSISINIHDLQKEPLENRINTIGELTKNEVAIPFDLHQGPLWRAKIIIISSHEISLLFTAHHIIVDGWSVNILMNEIVTLYCDLVQGNCIKPNSGSSFLHYAKEQQLFAASPKAMNHQQYWIKKFSEQIPPLELPMEKNRPLLRTFNAGCITRSISSELSLSIKKCSVEAGCSVFAVYLGVYAMVLHKITGAKTFVVGVPAAGQNFTGKPHLVGHCVNMLPCICRIEPDVSFIQNILDIQDSLYEAFENYSITFGELLKKLNVPRDPGRIPLIATGLTYVKSPGVLQFGTTSAVCKMNKRIFETFELYSTIIECENSVELQWHYNSDLFPMRYVESWLDGYETLLRNGCVNPLASAGSLSLFSQAAYDEIVHKWNRTDVQISSERTIVHDFEDNAQAFSDAVALEFKNLHLTYRELDALADNFAARLRTAGIRKGDVVAVCIDRGVEMVPALLSVLLVGAAYVPIDPAYPDERISYIISDCGARIIMTQNNQLVRFSQIRCPVLIVDNDCDVSDINKTDNEKPEQNDLAYIIYTSGSTGKPKGVEIYHGALYNFLYSMKEVPGMGPSDSILAVTTISFDIAGLELFLPLVVGAKIIIAEKEIVSNGKMLIQKIIEFRPTMMQATPSTWTLLLDNGWDDAGTMTLLCGGEAMTRALADRLLSTGAIVWNMYGPTETTIWSSLWRIEQGTNIPTVGYPIANTQLYIVDESMQPVAVGVKGELCIGGKGLARGYHNLLELTNEKFVKNPFTTSDPAAPSRLYRTGDIARRLYDGSIVISGRSDFQVKIRGYRIEMGEIEAVLLTMLSIRECVVVDITNAAGNKSLACYLVWHDGKNEPVDAILSYLRDKLPIYMIPSHFIFLEELPRLANNKIDRHALPPPSDERPHLSTAYAEPCNEIEKKIIEIWSIVLGVRQFGVLDNFFDIGGHSMAVAQVQRKIIEVFQREIEMIIFFEYPTVRSLAVYLSQDRIGQSNISTVRDRAAKQRSSFIRRGR